MPLVHEETRRAYIAQRGVSQGAAITLTSHVGGYQARFECATRCKALLGARAYADTGMPGIPEVLISTEELHRAITKLAETQSVALVDTATDEGGTRFVLIWRIEPAVRRGINPTTKAATVPQEENLDEY